MYKNKILLAIAAMVLFVVSATPANAQLGRRWYIDAGWQFNMAMSEMVSGSGQGWGAYAEAGGYVLPQLAVGGFVSYGTNNKYFHKKTFVASDGSALTSDYTNSLYQIPFGATLRYRFTRTKLQPYVEARIGAEYSQQSTYMATFRVTDSNWGFYVSPEIGLTWHPFRKTNFGFQLAVYYAHATNRSKVYSMDGIDNLGFRLGLSF